MNTCYKEIPAPKRVSDWKGKRVVSKYAVSSGLGSVPAGTLFTIRHTGIRKSLTSDRCKCCGFALHVDTKTTADQFLLEFKFIEELDLIITVDDLTLYQKSICCEKIKNGMLYTHEFAKLEEALLEVTDVIKLGNLGLNTDDLGFLTISTQWLPLEKDRHEYEHELRDIANVLTDFFRKEPQP